MFTEKSWHRCGLLALVAGTLLLPAAAGQVNIWTNRYDSARTGANTNETTLNVTNVNANKFGKLYSYPIDGAAYAQPLYISGLMINGALHNVLFVATMNDKVYAFDADSNVPALWTRDFTAPPSVTAVPITDITPPNSNIVGNVGVEGTPVIDQASATMYLVARTKENGAYVQRLHALDIKTGADRAGSPVTIQAAVQGASPEASGGLVNFDPKMQNQRAALALSNGALLIAWGSHEDFTPYHGWVMAYDAATLSQVGVFCTSPDRYEGGIWQAGRGPAIDSAGNAYYQTGNGLWDGTRNFGDSVLKFSVSRTSLSLVDWFTPDDYAFLDANDVDLGASGVTLMGDRLSFGGGKESILYLLNAGNLGHEVTGNTQIPQVISLNGGMVKNGPAFWTSATDGPLVYIWAQKDVLRSFHFNGTTIDTPSFAKGAQVSPGSPGGALTVSANGNTSGTGIVWASLSTSQSGNLGLVAGTLRAYDAETLQEIWDSDQAASRDKLGTLVKFVPPVVANGKVYMPNHDNALLVYGLLPNPTGSGVFFLPPASQSLTTLGTADWAHWGLIDNTSFDHKAGVASQISNFAVVNGEPGMVGNFSGSTAGFSWTDGTPNSSIASTTTGVYIAGQNRGFQIQVPADQTPRTLTVYVGVFATQARMVAHLSDSSSPDFMDNTFTSTGSQAGAYRFNYVAASAGQTFTITFTGIGPSGNVSLQAAALALNTGTSTTPDFGLTVGPSTQAVNPGGGTTYTATVTNLNGFNGTVNLTVSGMPSGATGTFSPVNSAGNSTLTVTTAANTAAASSTLTVTGTSGSLSHSVTVTLVVNSTTSTTPSAIAVNFTGGNTAMGNAETAGVIPQTNWNNAAGAASASPLSLVNQSGGATGATVAWTSDNTWISGSIADQAGNNRMMKGYLDTGKTNPTVITVASLAAGTYNIYVYADGDAGAAARTGIYQLSGPGITPTSISLTDASNTNFSGTFVQANNSNGNYVVFSGIAVSSGFTVTATPGQSTDIYARAAVNGMQIVPVSQAPADFTLTVGPSTQAVNPGGGTTYTATVTNLNGFNGTVNLTVSGMPSGATGTFSPVNSAGNSTLTVTTAANTAAGRYPLLITGTSGALSHSAGVTLIVNSVGGGGGGGAVLNGSFYVPTVTQNLTTLGSSDWAHWGLSSSTSFDHKSGVNPQISNYTVVNAEAGSVATSPYNPLSFSWTDGTPTASVATTGTSIYVAGLNVGFQVTVPADTTTRLLTIYVGINNTKAKLVAHLSDSSMSDYVDQSLQNSGQLCVAYTFVYAAASAGQSLTITWTTQQVNAYNSSVALIAATLSVVNPTADFVITASPSIQSIRPASAAAFNLTVAPQTGFGATVNLSVSGLPAGATGTLSSPAIKASGMPSLVVSASSSTIPGQYPITVTASSPGISHSTSLILNVLDTSQPHLGVSSSNPSSAVDLTSLGTADWAHWGLSSSTSFDHKTTGLLQISNYAVVGGQPGQVAQGAVPLPNSWSDGTPDVTATGTTSAVYITGLNTGYQLTVPADTTARVLTLYVGVFNTQGKLIAHLSDGSSPDYVDTSLSTSGVVPGAYAIAYRAASSGQALTVTFTFNSLSGPRCTDTSGVHCSVLLQSATLAAPGN